ncbi:sigma-70 family RNA polymerase sigma factor [Microvirga rosea]|uniref:sigma-70 family RNA polymerase sigma factor n=1 Tax=Microvirga rosea TaxID=2715425 RepID=UPI001D0B1E28|nr:sigma-70 family RNA polymerase sigma factor [Microvirga rosea]MCB8819787.1 sigma-70 family RNA polymerase sigma factor [Microvirga rosea]
MQSSKSDGRPSNFPLSEDTLNQAVRTHLGEQLRQLYLDVIPENLPGDLAKLVKRLERAIKAQTDAPDPAFMRELLDAVPNLRSFAISITRNSDRAEDLIQETILRAWDKRDKFEPGTNLSAWLFTILRNAFYSHYRKVSKEVEDSDGSYAAKQIVMPEQMSRLDLQDLHEALGKLSSEHREALLMVAAEGISYEEAAMRMGVAVGTVKSRVNRARARLAEIMGIDAEDAL